VLEPGAADRGPWDMNGEKPIALVVGGSRGIGRAICLRLARSGFGIWLTYRGSREAADGVRAEIEAGGGSCEPVGFDVADYEAVQAALAGRAETRPPEVVVFNAGVARDNLLVWMSKEEWDSVLGTNLDGFFNVMRAVLFPMLRNRRGRIVVVSSVSGQIGQSGQANYAASKAGLIGAAKSLAREIGKRNILVNVVAPGLIETDMTRELPRDQVLPLIPLQRLGKPEEVAAVVDFLCREEHMYIHGQVIGINGGLAI